MSEREKRYRNFVAIGYPESLVPDWLDKLSDTHIPFVISPLHDKDINPNKETKKEHYHIMMLYDAPHTYQQAQEVFSMIGATKCEIVNSTRGQARYLCHLDNQEKYQYSISDVKCLNGVDYQSLIELPSDNWQAVREMIQFINENDIIAYSDLLEYCSIHNESWFRCLLEKNTMVIVEYIKSRTWKKERYQYSNKTLKINETTGEVLNDTE